MYFLVGTNGTVRCRRAGKYDANADQTLRLRRNSDLLFNRPSVESSEKTRVYIRYGTSNGQHSGIEARKRKKERNRAIEVVCQRTAKVWIRR